MTLNTKGPMLWIILLQSRQLALGEVNVLCEFTTMHEDLRGKWAAIHHSEMTLELNSNSTKKKAPPKPNETTPEVVDVEVERIKKKICPENPNNWNKKIKATLEEPLKEAGDPSFTKIMTFCKKDV